MNQYLELLKTIKEKGTQKPPARAGMPGSLSLFGYQYRHDLADGFPLLTTKKISFKTVVTELLWFLRGDTNIKYLIDNGCNIWNEDAYNYYLKKYKNYYSDPLSFEQFFETIKRSDSDVRYGAEIRLGDYRLGDCGFQYGKVWRKWQGEVDYSRERSEDGKGVFPQIDQIANVIKGLKEAPQSRRHLVTAIDPAHDEDLALYWCHALFQFNCRPLTGAETLKVYEERIFPKLSNGMSEDNIRALSNEEFENLPKYYLDCHLYQRSADVVLGVPFNIASYSLLIHILTKICNMVPGEFIHSFGDVHIYDNHMDAVNEQLSREPRALPTLKFREPFEDRKDVWVHLDDFFQMLSPSNFTLEGYDPHPAIKAKLSTGLK